MNRDLEDTRALNELNELKENQENTMVFEPVNESQEDLYNDLVSNEDTKEFSNNNVIEEQKQDIKEEPKEKPNKLIDKWRNLSKKKKIIIISIIILLIVLIGIGIFLLTKKSDKDNTSIKDDIIIEKDNYIYQNGVLKLLNSDGKEVGEYECQNKDDKLCYVAYLSNEEDPFEVASKVYEDGTIIKSRAPIYFDKYAFIYDQTDNHSDTVYFYDIENKNVIDEYNGIKAYSNSENHLVLKNKNDEYGLVEINESGLRELIGYNFSYLGINNVGSKVVGKNNQGYIILTIDGKGVTKYLPNEIVNFNDSLIVAKSFGKYMLYNYEGNELISNVDYIRLINKDYVAIVNDKLLYIRDTENNKYNEDGIQLNNDKYIAVNTFDKDNKLIKTEEAFSIELNNEIVNITIDNNKILLDLKDGINSKYNQYYSYFDGKLYFYSDEAKTNVIGTYKCNNKIDNYSDNVKNCDVALSTNLSDTYKNPASESESRKTSLYNNKYIFIYDSKTLANEDNVEIKFYDITQNKVLGTYSLVDAESDHKYTFLENNDIEIIAKSKKEEKYGVIRIDKDGATVKHKFEYNHIERLSGYYYFIGENNDEKWNIISDKDNSDIEFKGKIMIMEHVGKKGYAVIQDEGDEVRLYPYEKNAKPINDKSFKYIVLFDDVYAGLDNKKKLWIYKYDSNTPINENGIRLEYTDNYYAMNDKPFKLNISSDKVKVSILEKNGKYEDDDTYSLEEVD